MAKTKAKRRKPLGARDPNLPSSATISNSATSCLFVAANLLRQDDREREKEVFAAVDRDLEAQWTTVRATCESQIANALLQLDLQQSKFSDEVLDMPLSKFLQEYCPNTEALESEEGLVMLRKKIGGEGKVHKEGGKLEELLRSPACKHPPTSVKEMLQKRAEKHLACEKPNRGEVFDTYSCKRPGSNTKGLGLESPMQTPDMVWSLHRKALMTPKTARLPKVGETLVSLHGSPLGVYGNHGITSVAEVQMEKTTRKLRSSMKVYTPRRLV